MSSRITFFSSWDVEDERCLLLELAAFADENDRRSREPLATIDQLPLRSSRRSVTCSILFCSITTTLSNGQVDKRRWMTHRRLSIDTLDDTSWKSCAPISEFSIGTLWNYLRKKEKSSFASCWRTPDHPAAPSINLWGKQGHILQSTVMFERHLWLSLGQWS